MSELTEEQQKFIATVVSKTQDTLGLNTAYQIATALKKYSDRPDKVARILLEECERLQQDSVYPVNYARQAQYLIRQVKNNF